MKPVTTTTQHNTEEMLSPPTNHLYIYKTYKRAQAWGLAVRDLELGLNKNITT